VTVHENGELEFTWSDRSNIEEGYEIYEGTTEGYSAIAYLPPNSTSYRHFPFASGFSYLLVAVKDGGYSDWAGF
jgi:hypothetical protein